MKKDILTRPIHRLTARLRMARTSMRPDTFMMLMATIVGIVTGVACVILKRLIALVSHVVLSHFHQLGANWVLIVLPVVGFGLATLFVTYVMRRPLSHGTDRLIKKLHGTDYDISKKLLYGPIVANVFTLGFGGSAGAEGPIAVTGASISGNLARALGMTPAQIRIFIGCGAGAGIAAIFKAPVGGMLFAFELLQLPFTTMTVLALLLACLTSAMTCYVFTGFTFDVFLDTAEPFGRSAYVAVGVFGIMAGLYSLYYTHMSRVAQRLVERMQSAWLRVVVGGLLMGGFLFLFPALYGEGYGAMDRMLNGHIEALYDGSVLRSSDTLLHLALVIGGMLLVKGFVVGITTSAGVAGDFAPTLFAGSLAGLLFATAANHLCGLSLPVGDFALIGMCAVFAGVIRAPFMAVFLTPEMTGNFTLFLPMGLASAICYGVVRLVKDHNYYHQKL